MVAAGNHEQERPCDASVDPFVAYQVRFRMPFARHSPLQRRNLYYAFRTGMLHVIVLTPYVATDKDSLQFQWLEHELRHRVDRRVTPWVCVIMHGPWYNSNTAHQGSEPHTPMKKSMEDLLYDFKVDLVISGACVLALVDSNKPSVLESDEKMPRTHASAARDISLPLSLLRMQGTSTRTSGAFQSTKRRS